MFKAAINLDVREMPTGKKSLDELKEFFDSQDKYKVADYCTYIKNCLSYRGRKSLKYYFTNENGQNKLIIEFADKKTFEFFKLTANECVFTECIEV